MACPELPHLKASELASSGTNQNVCPEWWTPPELVKSNGENDDKPRINMNKPLGFEDPTPFFWVFCSRCWFKTSPRFPAWCFQPRKIYEFVSWDDDSKKMWKTIRNAPKHQAVYGDFMIFFNMFQWFDEDSVRFLPSSLYLLNPPGRFFSLRIHTLSHLRCQRIRRSGPTSWNPKKTLRSSWRFIWKFPQKWGGGSPIAAWFFSGKNPIEKIFIHPSHGIPCFAGPPSSAMLHQSLPPPSLDKTWEGRHYHCSLLMFMARRRHRNHHKKKKNNPRAERSWKTIGFLDPNGIL